MINTHPSQWNLSSSLQIPEEEINRHIASLSNESIYDFLRTSFDNSKNNELKNINPEYLLQEDSFGQTMLHWAAVKGDAEITRFIIEQTEMKLFKSQTNVDEYTALHLAVYGGNNEVIDLLVNASVKNNLNDFVDTIDIHGQTALHLAASKGNITACNKLYFLMSVNAIALQTKDRLQTALHFAVQGGNYAIVELLFSRSDVVGELIEKVDKYGQSALHWAVDKPLLVDLLIKKANLLPLDLRKKFFLIKKDEGYTALHIAVHSTNNESNESVQSLIAATKDDIPEFISAIDKYGQTALHWAASNGNLIATQSLCEAMQLADINIQTTNNGKTALHFAAQGDYPQIIRVLMNKGAYTNLKDIYGETALHETVRNGNLIATQSLCESMQIANINIQASSGKTALHLAAEHGYEEIVILLMEKKADINLEDAYGQTALHWAVSEQHWTTFTYLCKSTTYPQDINNQTKDGKTALHFAAQRGHTETARLLLEKGADLNLKDAEEQTVLHLAAQRGHTEFVRLLLEKGADVNSKDANEQTALHLAAQRNIDTVRLLVDKGADIKVKDLFGKTPLHWAARKGDVIISTYLCDTMQKHKDKDFNDYSIQDNKLRTALHLAAQHGHEKIISLLLDKGAEIWSKDVKRQTALHLAAQHGHKEIVSLLLEKGADIGLKDFKRQTALHLAAQHGYKEIVKLLLEKGADINSKDVEEQTALHLAVQHGHKEIVSLLLEKGADINLKDTNRCTVLDQAKSLQKESKETIIALLEKLYK